MSGGYFNYAQWTVGDIASEIEELISSNNNKELDRYGQQIGREYPEDIIAKFDEARKTLLLAAAMAQRVDWLVSGDDGEECFRRKWAEWVDPLR